jgi:predicted mannosyl-3-phosphoglycerate phosphatase (HAD superfamily)
LIPVHGRPVAGLDEFTAALDHNGIPSVWVSSRTRLQLDDPRRKMGHVHPFIAEDGCGAYLPEDYFHLRPEKTLRLGRFMCIPVAAPQPVAAEALDALAEAAGVNVVPLRSLSPRELAQNSGLPVREAELLKQRDFDELFFLAGASQKDVERLLAEARARNIQLRERGILWSAVVGASLPRCMRDLSKLYERALRRHPATVGVGTARDTASLFPACDRRILLSEAADSSQPSTVPQISLRSPKLWQDLLDEIVPKRP